MEVPVLAREQNLFCSAPSRAGGAQKVALLAAEHYQRQGFDVVVVSFLPDKPLAHGIPKGIEWIDLSSVVRQQLRNRHPLVRGYRLARVWSRRLAASLMLTLAWPWLRTLQPGQCGWLLDWTMASVAGPHADELARLIRARRPQRVLSLLSRTNIVCCQVCWCLDCHLVISSAMTRRFSAFPTLGQASALVVVASRFRLWQHGGSAGGPAQTAPRLC